MKIAIIEDEFQARKLISNLLKKHFSSHKIIGEADSINNGVDLINTFEPDLVLLDIQLADGNGFEILDRVNFKKFKVIFTTSYSEYAIKAFKYGAINYLLKPFSEEDFIEALNRISHETLNETLTEIKNTYHSIKLNQNPSNISIPTIRGFEMVNLTDIIYFETIPDQISVTFRNLKKLRINKTLTEYTDLLTENGFERVHKSFLINLSNIKEYKYNDVGGILIMTDGKEIPVSRRKKQMILNLLKQNQIKAL